MRHGLRTVIYSMFLIAALFPSCARADVTARFGDAWVEDVDGVRVAHLSGNPHEIGLQHGKLLKDEIKGLIDYFFVYQKNLFGATVDDIAKGAEIMKRHIPDEYMEEMKGISEGSGVPFDKILYTNVFLDVVSAKWVGAMPQCSNFAAFPQITKDGNVVHGRNLDWSADNTLAHANTVFFITPKDGIPLVSISWPGMAGTLTGMNAEQITMGEMTSMSSDATVDGTPIMIQLRILLETSRNLNEAWKTLSELPRTTGYNVLVTDGKKDTGFIAEMTAKRIVHIDPRNGFLLHTNHFTDTDLAKTQQRFLYIYGAGKKSDTYFRYDRLLELLIGNEGTIDTSKAKSFLGDKLDPFKKRVTGDLENSICQRNTLQSVVMLPKTGEIDVALSTLPAPDSNWVRLTLPLLPQEK